MITLGSSGHPLPPCRLNGVEQPTHRGAAYSPIDAWEKNLRHAAPEPLGDGGRRVSDGDEFSAGHVRANFIKMAGFSFKWPSISAGTALAVRQAFR